MRLGTSREVVWQLRNVSGDAPRFVHRQNVCGVGIRFSLAAIDVSERLQETGLLHHTLICWHYQFNNVEALRRFLRNAYGFRLRR